MKYVFDKLILLVTKRTIMKISIKIDNTSLSTPPVFRFGKIWKIVSLFLMCYQITESIIKVDINFLFYSVKYVDL